MATGNLFAPKVDIPRPVYLGLGIATVTLFLGLWCILTYGGLTPPTSSPRPTWWRGRP